MHQSQNREEAFSRSVMIELLFLVLNTSLSRLLFIDREASHLNLVSVVELTLYFLLLIFVVLIIATASSCASV